LTDVDIAALVADHGASGALVTMAVVPNTRPDKYGGITADERGNLTGFVPPGSPVPSLHFIGVQVAEPAAFASVPAHTPHEVRPLYPALNQRRPGSVRVFLTAASFFDIGTPADYLSTALAIADNGNLLNASAGSAYHQRADIAADARVERSVLWDDVVVEPGAMLKECVVTDGVVVPADTSWHGVTLRVPDGELAPGERIIEGLAIGPIDR
jgi:NDP-sugar pyrophosphorylase family protein